MTNGGDTMDFENCLRLTQIAEGAYSNNPLDPGGETICGLARNKNPNLSIWDTVDLWKSRGVTDGAMLDKMARGDPYFMRRVYAIYKGQYWNPVHCDELPPLLRYPMFSACVNCGVVPAIKILQKSAGAKTDGVFGMQTYKAVIDTDVHILYNAFLTNWRGYYKSLVRSRPELGVFLNGWLRRVENVEKDNTGF